MALLSLPVECEDRAHVFAKPQDAGNPPLQSRPPEAKNRLLQSLPRDAYLRMTSDFKPVQWAPGSVVFENGERADHAYFPQDCVVSLQCATRDGASVEFGMVGSEGALGIEALFESGRMHGRALVARAGRALRIPVRAFMDSFRRYTPFRSRLLDFYGAFNAQVVQRSICHRVHTMEQQLGTWLLLMHDRSGSDELELTHEVMAGLLGGRREGVTIALRRLRNDRLVRSGYRCLIILDRAGLEARSCECYGVVRGEYARLIPSGGNRPNESGAGADRWNSGPIAARRDHCGVRLPPIAA